MQTVAVTHPAPAASSTEPKPVFVPPQLRVFVPPKLVYCGDLTQFTGGVFGSFSP